MKNNDEIDEKLVTIIRKCIPFIYENENIIEVNDIVEDLGLDSIAFMQLIIEIEECFNIKFTLDQDLSAPLSYDKLKSFVAELLKED